MVVRNCAGGETVDHKLDLFGGELLLVALFADDIDRNKFGHGKLWILKPIDHEQANTLHGMC